MAAGRLPLFLLAAVFMPGCLAGGCVGAANTSIREVEPDYTPLPHHVARTPEALSFRFAMVHDVVHERFPKHGPAFYRERGRKARAKLAAFPPDSDKALALMDDIGAGLDRLGKPAEAVTVLRDKHDRQTRRGLAGRAMYMTYANLGTFLIHAHMRDLIAGDPAARPLVEEGREFIRQSISVNPDAHFGREEWQLVVVNSFLCFAQEPALLREYDLIGNRLARDIMIPMTVPQQWEVADPESFGGRPFQLDWPDQRHFESVDRWGTDAEGRRRLRKYIAPVGAEMPPPLPPFLGRRAPFDEPCLGMIGMWRQGGGANPYFALSLGEIMLRVGQRYLAWSCYERAERLAGRFWPKPELQDFLRAHCRKRQANIEKSLPADEAAKLRPRFEAELAHGEGYQEDYQDYEAANIAEGVDIDDPTFFDAFYVGREAIASRPGPEEWYAAARVRLRMDGPIRAFLSWGLLTGGAVVFAVAVGMVWYDRRRDVREVTATTPSPTVTRSLIASNRFGPIPLTRRKSPTVSNGFFFRSSMIRCAYTGPIPGSVCNSSSVARFTSIRSGSDGFSTR